MGGCSGERGQCTHVLLISLRYCSVIGHLLQLLFLLDFQIVGCLSHVKRNSVIQMNNETET